MQDFNSVQPRFHWVKISQVEGQQNLRTGRAGSTQNVSVVWRGGLEAIIPFGTGDFAGGTDFPQVWQSCRFPVLGYFIQDLLGPTQPDVACMVQSNEECEKRLTVQDVGVGENPRGIMQH